MSAAVMMTYVVPMLLGQTYDLGKDKPGIQIFNSTTLENSKKIENYFTDSQYRMVENSDDIRNFLDVGGKLSLKVKSGMVGVGGEGSYLKERASRSNAIEILIKVNFETVTHSIASSWAPNVDWTLQDKKFLGTHYCRSITYGGELIASVRFLAKNQFDKEKIKGAIQAEVNAKQVEVELQGKLEMLKEKLHDTSSMEIRYYATVPIPGVSHDIASLMKLVDDFPKHVKSVNNGQGNPLRMELFPLNALQSTLPSYLENRALNDQLEDMEDQFDDLLTTRRDVSLWLSDLPPIAPQPVEEKISNFVDKIEELIALYTKAISEFDLAVGSITSNFEGVFKAYRDGGYIMPGKYAKKLRLLQKEIYKEAEELEPVNGGGTYIRWGKPECQKNEETALTGAAVSSAVNQNGGSSTFQCSPVKPDLLDPSTYFTKGYDSSKFLISPVKYRGKMKKFQSGVDKTISCAVCRAVRSTSVIVLHAFTSCPAGWTLAYEGFAMAPGNSADKREYICVDNAMHTSDFGENSKNSVLVQEVSVKCGMLPCEVYKNKVPLRCIVCKK